MGKDGKVTTVTDKVQLGNVYKELVVSLFFLNCVLMLQGRKRPPFMFADSLPKKEIESAPRWRRPQNSLTLNCSYIFLFSKYTFVGVNVVVRNIHPEIVQGD